MQFLLKNIAGMTTSEEKNYSSDGMDKSGLRKRARNLTTEHIRNGGRKERARTQSKIRHGGRSPRRICDKERGFLGKEL